MRPGQHNNNNKRNRNRNRKYSGGGGGNQNGGGSGANRVYDSNGPDVKLRGTAHTIAEKYMQLARDAQSSGDSVMAESYYQFADHYYRVWLAAQPAGQPIQFSRRNVEEDFDEEGSELPAEGSDVEGQDGGEGAEASAEGGEQASEGDQQGSPENRPQDRNERYNNRDGGNNREGGNNRFRQRWPRRNDRYGQEARAASGDMPVDRPERTEASDDQGAAETFQRQELPQDDGGNWEAPSFLKRPAAPVAESTDASDEAPAPRARGRKPRAAAVEDAPQDE